MAPWALLDRLVAGEHVWLDWALAAENAEAGAQKARQHAAHSRFFG